MPWHSHESASIVGLLQEGSTSKQTKSPLLNPLQKISGETEPLSIGIPLPHNTLLIMWPPCQEEWRHEVPRCSNTKLEHNPISGSGRLNLTFRVVKPEWVKRVPLCRCGKRAIMKAKVGVEMDGSTKYYYSCDTTQGAPCGYFQWVEMEQDSLDQGLPTGKANTHTS